MEIRAVVDIRITSSSVVGVRDVNRSNARRATPPSHSPCSVTIIRSERLDLRVLWSGPGIRVLATRWRRVVHPAESEASTPVAAIELMRRGGYRKRVGRTTLVGDPNTAVFFNPGETFRVQHQEGDENAGTTIHLEASRLDEVRAEFGRRRRKDGRLQFQTTHALTPPRVCLLHHGLIARLRSRDNLNPLFVEELVLQIVHEVLARSEAPLVAGRLAGPDAATAVALDRIAAVQEHLNSTYSRKLTLGELGNIAGCSSWHIARLFRRQVGVPIHRYLIRLRLRHAMAELADGEHDLTALALRCGFSSHSHFTAAFRSEFTQPPRGVRRLFGLSSVTPLRPRFVPSRGLSPDEPAVRSRSRRCFLRQRPPP